MIDVGPIGQDHIGKGARVLIVTVGLDRDFFPKGEGRGGVLGSFAERLAFLGAVDAVTRPGLGEADPGSASLVVRNLMVLKWHMPAVSDSVPCGHFRHH